MIDDLRSLVAVTAVVAAAPIVVARLPGRVPEVVALLLGGIAIGPSVLAAAQPGHVALFARLGLGFLFLLAGYEFDASLLRERVGRLALASWLLSVLVSVAIVSVLAGVGLVHYFPAVAIGLTTTALGTLLPVLREHQLHRGAFARYVFAAGAVGEVGPVLAIAVLLGRHGSLIEVIAVAVLAAVAFGLSVVPRLIQGTWIRAIIVEKAHDTSQATLRLTLLLLTLLLLLSAAFGLDVVLGAFFAGMVLKRVEWTSDAASLEHKLDAVGYGFFIPVFFVSSGMSLDVRSIVGAPVRLMLFFALLFLVRGMPVFLLYRRDLSIVRRLQLSLLTATALPLLVALAEVGLEGGLMLPENAAALVGAGVLSVACFPVLAVRLESYAHRLEAGSGAPTGSS